MASKKLLRCRTCSLTWFPEGGAASSCPACGGKELGGAFQPFHLGVMLIGLALAGWMRPFLNEQLAGERPVAAASAAGPTRSHAAEPERAPTRAQTATERRREKVTVRKRKHRRKKDRRGKVYVTSNDHKRRQKAKTRSEHVQR